MLRALREGFFFLNQPQPILYLDFLGFYLFLFQDFIQDAMLHVFVMSP